MFRVIRPGPQLLVIQERPAQALFRLAIWITVVCVYYVGLLEVAPAGSEPAQGALTGRYHEWLLLLVPLFLLPYLISCLKVLLSAKDLTFDARVKVLTSGHERLASFSEISELRLRSVHGTCEEYILDARLADGRNVKLFESEASAAAEALADEISGLVGVRVTRRN